MDFEQAEDTGDFQGCPVMNYCDPEVPHTRITEHKHFAPWESHEGTVTYTEFSRLAGPEDIPYYPIRLVREKEQLHRYVEMAGTTTNVTFLGRLGTYRYLDMDVTIKEALEVASVFLENRRSSGPMPVFVTSPL